MKPVHDFELPPRDVYGKWILPMVEIFETIEGEGMYQGFPTVFVRSFHCNLRCAWCDTPYSFAPAKPAFKATIDEIAGQAAEYPSRHICFTGGEPLIHQKKSAALIKALCDLEHVTDVHIETNGAIDLAPFARLREKDPMLARKMRFVMDYKLAASGETKHMILSNFNRIAPQDEIKFVIGTDEDFNQMKEVLSCYYQSGQVLLSPVWETMPPGRLVEKVLAEPLPQAKISLQLHKIIWDPNKRGV